MLKFILGIVVGIAAMWLVGEFRSTPTAQVKPEAGTSSAGQRDSPIAATPPTGQAIPSAPPLLPQAAPSASPAMPPLPRPPIAPMPETATPTFQSTAEHRDLALGVSTPEPPSISELHRRIEREPKDLTWSSAAQQYIRTYISERTTSPEIDLAVVECRQTLCEIQAFAYSREATSKWGPMIAAMVGASSPLQFEVQTFTVKSENGKMVLLTILYGRKR